MTFRNAVRVVVAAVCVLAATLTGGASTFNRTTYFTFSAPVRVQGVPVDLQVFTCSRSRIRT